MGEEIEEIEWARERMDALLDGSRSCILGTAADDGTPLASYAPFCVDEKRRFDVYVSAMALHYGHLRRTGRASVMLIEDEAKAENLFARQRLTLDCAARLVDRGSEEFAGTMERMEARLGSTMGYLRELLDFGLFQLAPSEGRLVLGFGKAYRVGGEGLAEIGFLGGGGHRSKS